MSWFIGGALPALAADTINTSVYLDTDNNGAIDTIRWTFDENVTACVYEASDWTVNTAGDMNVVVTGLLCSGGNAILNISVTADANETGLQTGAGNNPVISYANQGNPNDLTLTSGNMAAHASVAVTDGAKPIIKTSVFGTYTTGNTTFNQLTLTYSEVLVASTDGGGDSDVVLDTPVTSTTTLGSMTTAKTLAGIATWNGASDMTQNGVTDNRVSFQAVGNTVKVDFNYTATGYFNAGSTAPTTPSVTPVEDATDVTDLNDNPVNSAQTPVVSTNSAAWDITAPTVEDSYSCDTDADGDINVIQLDFDDNMLDASFTAGNLELDNDATNNATGEETVLAVNTAISGCDVLGILADADANDDLLQTSLTTGINGTDIAYFHNVTTGIRDDAGNRLATGAALGTEVDAAAPLFSSSTPADADEDVSRSDSFTLTFTEPIDTGDFEAVLTTYSGTLSVTWSGGNSIATINPSTTLSGNTEYTITVTNADDSIGNIYGGNVTGVVEPLTFTTASSSSSSGGSSASTAATYEVTLTAPTGGETLTPGGESTITWTTGGTGNISYVNLYYSLDGSTFTSIEAGTVNDGSYTWTVPDADTSTAEIRIEATDLASALDTDTSDSFTIGTVSETDETTEENIAPGTNVYGNSPVTGEIEEISAISVGDYFKAESYSTVYYLDANSTRRPFNDSQTFFTWQDDFSDVLTVTDATLPIYTLGAPMLPQPGVVLMKIQSDSKVYAIETDPADSNKAVIRWVPDEATAVAVYGSGWADYVIDVDVTLFSRFTKGTNITSGYNADTSIMKKRVDLH